MTSRMSSVSQNLTSAEPEANARAVRDIVEQ